MQDTHIYKLYPQPNEIIIMINTYCLEPNSVVESSVRLSRGSVTETSLYFFDDCSHDSTNRSVNNPTTR